MSKISIICEKSYRLGGDIARSAPKISGYGGDHELDGGDRPTRGGARVQWGMGPPHPPMSDNPDYTAYLPELTTTSMPSSCSQALLISWCSQ